MMTVTELAKLFYCITAFVLTVAAALKQEVMQEETPLPDAYLQ